MSAGLNEREYNIILHKGVDYGEFFNSLVDITNKDGIPNRKVIIANPRNGSYRQTHFYLTEVEKKQFCDFRSQKILILYRSRLNAQFVKNLSR